MRVVVWKSRAIALGLVFAMAGFSLAITSSPDDSPSAGGRSVGSTIPLHFTNPLVAGIPGNTNEYDLGDACFGSSVTRYITAAGGLKPYRFTSSGPVSLANVIEGFRTNLQLGLSGVLAGSLPAMINGVAFPSTAVAIPPNATGAPGFRFFVQVQDAKSTNPSTATGFFNLFLIDCNGMFKFAMDQIPSALLASSYSTKVEVLGAVGTPTFSLVSVSGPGVTSAKDLGVFVASDGTILGVPLKVGTFTLTVHCVDSQGRVANNRANTAPDQAFTLVVTDNPITSSDATTLQCSVRGDRSKSGHDMLRFKGFVNFLGQDNFSLLNADIAFKLAGVGFNGRLDRNGKFSAILADRSKVKAKVNASAGTMDVTITNGTFTKALGFDVTPPAPPTTRLPIQVTVGNAVTNAEVIDFDTKVSGSRYALNYALARDGSSAGGGFQIVSVKGKDESTFSGLPGDAWRASFLALPRAGVTDPSGLKQGLDGITSATIRIGENFTQKLGSALVSNSNGVRFKGTLADGVKNFALNTKKFKGSLQTNVLSSKVTGIVPAVDSVKTGNVFFPLGLDLVRTGAPYTGEHARRVFGYKNQYRDKPPKR